MSSVTRVALTGGIAAGKSEVLSLLREAGAYVLDADDLAREVVLPGSSGLQAVADTFGPEVLDGEGALHRARMADVVFSDPAARERLEGVLHPLISALAEERMSEAPPGSVVVYAIPLLAETGASARFDVVVLVHAPEELRLARLVGCRGMSEDQARARMRAQVDDAGRRACADIEIDNSGDRAHLRAQVDALWQRLSAQA